MRATLHLISAALLQPPAYVQFWNSCREPVEGKGVILMKPRLAVPLGQHAAYPLLATEDELAMKAGLLK